MECIICGQKLDGNKRKYCSSNCKGKGHWKDKKSPNTMHSQTRRAVERKILLIQKLGGKCCKCGYDRNITALEFHHKDPETKSFNLDQRKISNTKLDILLEEVDKCILVCANCHRELEHPDMKNIMPGSLMVKAPD